MYPANHTNTTLYYEKAIVTVSIDPDLDVVKFDVDLDSLPRLPNQTVTNSTNITGFPGRSVVA